MSRALASVPDSPLDRLAREVRSHHQQAETAWQNAVEHAWRCGQVLIEAKTLCRHGEWLPWLREVGIHERTAQVYMRLARQIRSPADLPATITEALDSLGDRERRERRARRQKLSAEFDRVVGPPGERRPDWPVFWRSYRDLAAENPDWAWKILGSHMRELLDVEGMPSASPDRAEELRTLVRRLQLALDPRSAGADPFIREAKMSASNDKAPRHR